MLFPLAALLLLAGLIAALVLGIAGDLADAGDDVLPLLLGLAALTGVIGWFLERRHADGRAA